MVINQQDVIDSIERLVELAPFEREYENIGGGVIKQLLFDSINAATTIALEGAITNVIKSNEPRANLQELVVNGYINQQIYVVNIIFSMINNPNPISFQIVLKKIR